MGPYCQNCDRRCFVERFVPDSNVTILATCPKGMAHDRERTGYDHTTAVNPHDPAIKAYAAAIRENTVRRTVTSEAFAEAVLAGAKGCLVPPGMQPGRSISASASNKAEAAAQLEFVRRTLRYALTRVGVA